MSQMEQMEISGAGEGNTDSSPAKRQLQYTYWFFTLNNYDLEQIEHMEQVLKFECDWYVFQEEKGEKGTQHLQGTVKFKQRKRLTEIKKFNPKIHWEHTKCVKSAIAYCLKQETRCGKQWVYGIELPEEVEVEDPHGWQLEIMEILKEKPDKRTIHWFWEPEGNVGKTTLCKFLVVRHECLMLTGKSHDMYNMIAKFPNKRKLFIVDCPRSAQEYINYGAIEQMKNGLIFSGKYEGHLLVFNCPHVFVFANQPPDKSKMSMDRWNIQRIDCPRNGG